MYLVLTKFVERLARQWAW